MVSLSQICTAVVVVVSFCLVEVIFKNIIVVKYGNQISPLCFIYQHFKKPQSCSPTFSILGTHFYNLSQFFRLYMVTSVEPVRTSFADLDITSGSVHQEKRA